MRVLLNRGSYQKEDDWARKRGGWRNDIDELREDYWNLHYQFNPHKFDAADWAKTCKEAGFRYMIFTTKHHDGFNMYDTNYSDYKVTSEPCPFAKDPRADIFGEVATAFRNEGVECRRVLFKTRLAFTVVLGTW
ncbi:alpha-L-fucosidase [Enterococcus sp. DIV1314a]|uniref:alpha-L-fucosidase n=1 Tax=Enterococcus sp. DIV1314a TaxID=2774660 RepID=UPI003F2072C8